MHRETRRNGHQNNDEIRRALATGYALALIEHGLFVVRSCSDDAHEETDADATVLEFADWFAARADWSLSRSYRHWRAHVGELNPEALIPLQTPRSAEVTEGTRQEKTTL